MPTRTPERSSLQATTRKLRDMALGTEADALLGSEDEVLARIAVSRTTLKQAARLLEQEGLVRVRRGVNGGYYSARPTEETLTAVASAYLDSIAVSAGDIVALNTTLWLEVVRLASRAAEPALAAALGPLIRAIDALGADATFHEVDAIEQASRRAIFDLVDCRYIELIMRINQAFGARHPFATAAHDGTVAHRAFVAAWRRAKAIELQAIVDADTVLAKVAARNARTAWDARVSTGLDELAACRSTPPA